MTGVLEGLLAEQAHYYREHTAEYDDGWFRRGRYDHGRETNNFRGIEPARRSRRRALRCAHRRLATSDSSLLDLMEAVRALSYGRPSDRAVGQPLIATARLRSRA